MGDGFSTKCSSAGLRCDSIAGDKANDIRCEIETRNENSGKFDVNRTDI